MTQDSHLTECRTRAFILASNSVGLKLQDPVRPAAMTFFLPVSLAEDQAVSYELFKDERRGKTSAVDLKVL